MHYGALQRWWSRSHPPHLLRARPAHPRHAKGDQAEDNRNPSPSALQAGGLNTNQMGSASLLDQSFRCPENPDDGQSVARSDQGEMRVLLSLFAKFRSSWAWATAVDCVSRGKIQNGLDSLDHAIRIAKHSGRIPPPEWFVLKARCHEILHDEDAARDTFEVASKSVQTNARLAEPDKQYLHLVVSLHRYGAANASNELWHMNEHEIIECASRELRDLFPIEQT